MPEDYSFWCPLVGQYVTLKQVSETEWSGYIDPVGAAPGGKFGDKLSHPVHLPITQLFDGDVFKGTWKLTDLYHLHANQFNGKESVRVFGRYTFEELGEWFCRVNTWFK